MKIRITHIVRILFLASSLALFFPALHFVLYILILGVMVTSDWSIRVWNKQQLPYLFLFLYVLWTFVSLVYSSNISEGLHYVEKGMPLFLVALVGLFTLPQKKVSLRYIGSVFRLSTLVFLLVCFAILLFAFWRGQLLGWLNINGISNIDVFDPILHRTYASALLLISFVPIFLALKHKEGNRILSIISVLIILFTVYWSGARIALLSSALLLSVFFISYSYGLVSKLVFYPSLLLLLLIFSTLLFSSPRVKQSYWNLQQGKELSQVFDRSVTWTTALRIVQDKLWLGVGVGDAQDLLNEKYIAEGNTLWAKRDLNTHNQYLQTLLETGIVGLCLLLAFLVSLLFCFDQRKRIYAISLLVVYGVNFMFESMLLRTLGFTPLAFFLLALHLDNNDIESNSNSVQVYLNRLTLVVIFALSVAVMLICLRRDVDRRHPSTYMTVDYTMLDYAELPLKESLPQPTSGVLLDADNIELRPDRVGEFLSFDVGKLSEDIAHTISYSYWCYVSHDCNLDQVRIYIYNRGIVGQQAAYDLDKKGTWQCLEIHVDSAFKYTQLGARVDVLNHQEIEGSVVFALPNIVY